MALLLLALAFAASAQDTGFVVDHGADFDDDAWYDDVDCSPLEPADFPGSPEICDYKDNDCDGDIDEAPECRGCGSSAAYSEGLGLSGALLLPLLVGRRRRFAQP